MAALLEVDKLRVHFPTADGPARAVDGIGFTVAEKETLCLVGESGCGKSTAARALLRLLPATASICGTVRFQGVSLLDLPESELRPVRGGGIGVVFQESAAALNPIYSVGSHLVEAIRLHRPLSRRAAGTAALDLLREVQLPDAKRIARQYPHELSGGMAQRVGIALALAGQPRLLIADEPTSALDAAIQAEILDLLRRLQVQHNMALLLISHDLDLVARMANRVAVMYAGKIVEHGPLEKVFASPLHLYTEGLLNCRPRLGQRERLRSIDGIVPPATHWPTGCRFRPRCPYQTEECAEEPELIEHEPERWAACWHWRRDSMKSANAKRNA